MHVKYQHGIGFPNCNYLHLYIRWLSSIHMYIRKISMGFIQPTSGRIRIKRFNLIKAWRTNSWILKSAMSQGSSVTPQNTGDFTCRSVLLSLLLKWNKQNFLKVLQIWWEKKRNATQIFALTPFQSNECTQWQQWGLMALFTQGVEAVWKLCSPYFSHVADRWDHQ